MRRFSLLVLSLTAITLTMSLISLKTGVAATSWQDVADIFTADSGTAFLLREVRLMRILLALLAGSALGISGAILQRVLHNDLASPEIIGISSGAGCAGIAWLLYCGAYPELLGAAAFAGAMVAALTVYFAAWKQGISPARLILAGVALSTLAGTLVSALLLLNSDKLTGIFEFTLGGVAGKGRNELFAGLPFFAAAFIMAGALTRRLEILSLDDASAASLGINVERTRLVALAAAALAAGSAAAAAGLLGFVGLMAPHIAQKMLNSASTGKVLFLSALTGALLSVTGEWLGRVAAAPRELPAGMFLSAAGALFFLVLLLKSRRMWR